MQRAELLRADDWRPGVIPMLSDSQTTEDGTQPLRYEWDEDEPAAQNYAALGKILARSGDLLRRGDHADGLLLVDPDGHQRAITSAVLLNAAMLDRVALAVYLNGKLKGNQLSASHLNTMLRAESFLGQFPVVDYVSTIPFCLPDFTFTRPGFNDGGPGHRVLYLGDPPLIYDSLDRVHAFLDVMAFATNADRTNAVAAALTVMLRNHWPGGKPIVLATATKSHAGKDTVIMFAAGETRQCSVSYQSTDWALERCMVGALSHDGDIGVVVVENARLNRRDQHIASAFIERFATDPEPFLFSTGTGPAVRRRNDIVLAISTNFGTVSEDELNRSISIHLAPVGNVSDRKSPIGNPKLEFLPENRREIAAELRGMIQRWRQAGMPRDTSVRHPFSEWAAIVGGILKVNGFEDFLANYGTRRTADDPLRKAIGLLGAGRHGESWYRPGEWARLAVKFGLDKQVIPKGDQGSGEAHKRGMGVILSAHQGETFEVETDSEILCLRLERKRGRFGEKDVHVRYRFVMVKRESLAEDPE